MTASRESSNVHSHDHDTHAHHHAHSVRLQPSQAHDFLGANHQRNEKRSWMVIVVTVVMMIVEIIAGHMFGSMALVADGWHMATHAGAILVAAIAYSLARRHVHNRRFTFGTGKFGELAAFSSAIFLGLVSIVIAFDSLERLVNPVPINFREALIVATIGLIVNIVCAFLLKDDHSHASHSHASHSHGSHSHGSQAHAQEDGHQHSHHHDRNLRAAYIHVLADALTSVTAIMALVLGAAFGWVWLDPVIGIAGALVIAFWALGLIRDSALVLVDYVSFNDGVSQKVDALFKAEGATVHDLHVWQLGPGHYGVIVCLTSANQHDSQYYREKLSHIARVSHATVEIVPAV